MPKPSGATVCGKTHGSTVSSPRIRRILSCLGAVETPEGPAVLFYVSESSETSGVIDGQINLEASDPDPDKCPKCNERLDVTLAHRNSEGDITNWDVECPNCGLGGQVWND